MTMTVFENRTFGRLFDRDSGRLFNGIEFQHCYFQGCALSLTHSPELRSTVRDVILRDCEQRGCIIEAAVFDTVTVDGLETNGLLQTWATVCNHVTLRGRIERLMCSSALAPDVDGLAPPSHQRRFDDANETFYASVDWALDIREAEFEECDLRGVPGHLIRRDPSTQVLITRSAAMTGRWRSLDLSDTYWPTALDFFLESQAKNIVLVAPKRHRKFKRYLDGLLKLRDCGVAEPD